MYWITTCKKLKLLRTCLCIIRMYWISKCIEHYVLGFSSIYIQVRSIFTIKNLCIGPKMMGNCKPRDLQCIKTKMLKWIGKEAHTLISAMFNHALQHSLAHDRSSIWFKP